MCEHLPSLEEQAAMEGYYIAMDTPAGHVPEYQSDEEPDDSFPRETPRLDETLSEDEESRSR